MWGIFHKMHISNHHDVCTLQISYSFVSYTSRKLKKDKYSKLWKECAEKNEGTKKAGK